MVPVKRKGHSRLGGCQRKGFDPCSAVRDVGGSIGFGPAVSRCVRSTGTIRALMLFVDTATI